MALRIRSISRTLFLLGITKLLAFITLCFYMSHVFGSLEAFLFPSFLRGKQSQIVSKPLVIPAYRVCKPGPPLGYPEPPSKMKNCLVIGDSVSIGYTPFLRDRLKDICRVQRSPVDNKYGGARDSRYGRHCLPMFLRTTSGNSTFYDVIIFNFGLHDVTFLYDKKFMDITLSEYSSNLAHIKQQLGQTGAKLVFLTTTPAPHNTSIDKDIVKYNTEAIKIMSAKPKVVVYDLYKEIVDRCHGNTKDNFQKCGIFRSPSNDVHFNDRGSDEIARHIAELLKSILPVARPYPKDLTRSVAGFSPNWVRCRGRKNVVVACPPGSSCCKIKYTEFGVGCCHLTNPVQCGDDNHYCDQGWVCNPKCWVMKCFCHKTNTTVIPV